MSDINLVNPPPMGKWVFQITSDRHPLPESLPLEYATARGRLIVQYQMLFAGKGPAAAKGYAELHKLTPGQPVDMRVTAVVRNRKSKKRRLLTFHIVLREVMPDE